MNPDDLLDRNLENLIRRAAEPVRDERLGELRKEFLDRIAQSPAPRSNWRRIAMVASIAAAAALAWALLASPPPATRPQDPGTARQEGPAAKPAAPQPSDPGAPSPAAPPRPAPVQAKGHEARDGEMNLSCRPVSRNGGETVLRLEGTTPLPEGTVLMVSLHRWTEAWAAGRLVSSAVEAGAFLVREEGRGFRHDAAGSGPGRYLVTVRVEPDFQREEVLKKLKALKLPDQWSFDVPGWGDELAGQLSARLDEIDASTVEVGEFVRKMEKACGSAAEWEAQRRALNAEGAKLLAKLARHPASGVYPAAHGQLFNSVRSLLGAAGYIAWKEGVMTARTYHADEGQDVKTFRGDLFSFEAYRRYVVEASAVGGREFALWIAKDLRRGGIRPALADAVRLKAGHTGVPDGLLKAEDLDALERSIRER